MKRKTVALLPLKDNSQRIKGKNFNSKLLSISDKPNVMESGAKYVWVGYDHSGS